MRVLWMLLPLLAVALPARADVLLRESFDEKGPWQMKAQGQATVELVDGGRSGKCLKTTAEGGTAYYTLVLKPEDVAGHKLTVRCFVRLEDVRIGPQTYSTAKLHVGATVAGEVKNYATRFVGTTDWEERELVAAIPDDATAIVLDLGIQGGTGTAYYDDLVIEDDQMPFTPISLLAAANSGRSDGVADDGAGSFLDTGFLDLRALPQGEQTFAGMTFEIPAPGSNLGNTCIALRGKERPNLPESPKEPIAIGRKARALAFLHVAGWARERADDPCLTYEVTYADGKRESIGIREGVEIFRLDAPRDLPACKVAWRARTYTGAEVGLGLFRWENPRPNVAIQSVLPRSTGTGATPVLVALTTVR